eukprot:TRINITY_DN3046_c0_g1_i3.p1 TRINITY_DN3046_c0_g1~~TRINITY_DN3046_c0_g1_i3.p1  ORF type:complete len:619 (-),score=134.27 TRINITY_DN3046_c0_g1_i3:1606-3426(-)
MELSEVFGISENSKATPWSGTEQGECLLAWAFPSMIDSVANCRYVSFSDPKSATSYPEFSYVLLHVQFDSSKVESASSSLVAIAGAACTSTCDVDSVDGVSQPFSHWSAALEAGPAAAFALYVWHGKQAAALTRALALSNAFRLERVLRLRPLPLLAHFASTSAYRAGRWAHSRAADWASLDGAYRVLQRGKRSQPASVGADEMDGWSADAMSRQFGPVASQVSDWLYLGGEQPAAALPQLEALGVTHVLNCAGLLCAPMHAPRLGYLTLRLLDGAGQDLISVLPWALDYLESVRQAGGRVYVHCQQGVSRSVSVVVAYEMWRLRCTFAAALERVKRRRPIASPHAAFIVQLIQWEKYLRQPPGPRLYYMARLSEREPLEVAKAFSAAEAAAAGGLDARTAWIAVGLERTFVWSAAADTPPHRTALARHWAELLHRFLQAPGDVLEVVAGSEPAEFWAAAGVPSTARVQRLPRLDPELDSPSTDADARATPSGSLETAADAPVPSASRLWARSADGGWERLVEFDYEDLAAEGIFLLDATRVAGSESAVFVWLGAETDVADAASVVDEFRHAQPDELPLNVDVRRELADHESDRFWHYFEHQQHEA